jgi:hypothetical protein
MSFELLPLKPEQHTLTFVPKLAIELPFFNLTNRRKDIPRVIKYRGKDAAGRPLNWEVYQDSSEEIGAPAVEAHEVWYLLVKPSIDSHRLPNGDIPEIIPLGGVRDCLRKVGWTSGGYQGHELIKALTQISFAGCVADLWLPTGERDREGKERFLQIKGRFSRMSVYAIGEHHLTEEELSQKNFDFDLEDVIYIRLDPLEAKLQQLQDRRILDNQYLFSVNPAGRRWYELMAGKIFGVVKNKGEFCEIRYSWYIKHHHTLKLQHAHKRVRFQMDRVVKDHLASGYIRKVEYRPVKEPDQEIDYGIRYYPGPGAQESNARIQTLIREKRKRRKLNAGSAITKQENAAAEKPSNDHLALSIITANHHELIYRLVVNFQINPIKAYHLVIAREEAVSIQLDAWAFRESAPRNPAGWMIQAIENNYALPPAYLNHKNAQRESQSRQLVHDRIRSCSLCDDKGFRHIRSAEYPNGAMRQCTHDRNIETRYEDSGIAGIAPNAQNSPPRDDFSKHEKGPAEDSASP